MALAIRSPCGEYLANPRRGRVFRELQCPRWRLSSYSTQRRDETSSVDVVVILVPEGFVFARVPYKHLAKHFPRCDPSAILGHSETLGTMLRFHLLVFVCRLPFTTPPLQRYSPFAENVTACTQLRKLISITGFNDQHQPALHLVSTHRSSLTT